MKDSVPNYASDHYLSSNSEIFTLNEKTNPPIDGRLRDALWRWRIGLHSWRSNWNNAGRGDLSGLVWSISTPQYRRRLSALAGMAASPFVISASATGPGSLHTLGRFELQSICTVPIYARGIWNMRAGPDATFADINLVAIGVLLLLCIGGSNFRGVPLRDALDFKGE